VAAVHSAALPLADIVCALEQCPDDAEPSDWILAAGLNVDDVSFTFSHGEGVYINFVIAIGDCLRAIRLEIAGRTEDAWNVAVDAARWEGMLVGGQASANDVVIDRLTEERARLSKAQGWNRGKVEPRVQVCRDLKARYGEGAAALADRISKAVNCSDGGSWDDPEGPAIRRVFKLEAGGTIADRTGRKFNRKGLIELITNSTKR
jgi:hypothetical protein